MSTVQTCPNCSSADARSVFTDANNHVVECTGCRLQYAQAYPDYSDADAEIYNHDYFAGATDADGMGRRERVFGQLMAEVEAILGRCGRLLDVGAGEGTLMRIARDRGWEAEGTDISSAMIPMIRERFGMTVHHGALEDAALAEGSFDALVMNHVLEHVRNPNTTLRKVAALLVPDGVARIEVPNIASLSSRVKSTQSRLRLKSRPWKHYATNHHFWYFTAATLERTLEAAGLEVLELSSPAKQWQPETLLKRVGDRVNRHAYLGRHLVAFVRPAVTIGEY